MPRAPLPPGTAGAIKTYRTPGGWKARCRYRDLAGYVHFPERHGRTPAKATRRLQEALRDDPPGPPGVPGAAVTPATKVAELVEPMLATAAAEGAASGTLRRYRQSAEGHIVPALGGLAVAEVRPAAVQAALTQLGKRFKPNTVRTARAVASQMLAVAVAHGALESNPVREVARITGGRSPARHLTMDERLKLLRTLDADEAADNADLPDLVRFMLGTGLRVGEALAVAWADVDLEGARVRVTHKIVRAPGGAGVVRVPGTKAETAEEAAQAPPVGLPAFLVLVLTDRANRREDPSDGDAPLFPTLRGARRGQWRDPSSVASALRRRLDAAGFDWVTTHNFRKTAATAWDEAGLSPREIADLLRHSDIATHQRYYLGRSRQMHPTAAALLDRAMGGGDESGVDTSQVDADDQHQNQS